MPERPTGTPCWVDIATPDVAGAIPFYAGVFGWDCHEGGPEVGGYTMCLLDGRPAAAISPQMQGGTRPPYWTTYIASDDVEATVAAATAAGGTVLAEPMDVMSFGRMAMLRDPAGVAFGVWEKRDHRGFLTDWDPGSVCWHEHISGDPDAAATFLGAVFGLVATDYPGMDGYRILTRDGANAGGLMAAGADHPPAFVDQWVVYIAVADADASCARAVELGGSVLIPSFPVPGIGRIAFIADPQGGHVGIVQGEEAAA